MLPSDWASLKTDYDHETSFSAKAVNKSKRRQSGNLRQKQLHEESVDDTNTQDLQIAKETGNFEELNKFIEEHTDDERDVSAGLQFHSMNARPSNDYSKAENRYADVGSAMSTNSQGTKSNSVRSGTVQEQTPPQPQPQYAKGYRNSSSRRPNIPKDSKPSAHVQSKIENEKSIFTQKHRSNQLSINLRKGSPIKAEVDLFASNLGPEKPSVKHKIEFEDQLGPN